MLCTPERIARELLDVAPAIVRVIRTEMRSHRLAELTMPQFRTMAYLNHHPGASLSDVAEHIGLTLPTMSKLVHGLVARQLATREMHTADRRRFTLALTTHGRETWETARQSAQAHLAKLLTVLSESERATVEKALETLRPIFVPGPEVRRRNGRSE